MSHDHTNATRRLTVPRTQTIELFSSTITEWARPGEHFLWGTYDLFPRPSWWQRLLGTRATHPFRLRLIDLASAMDASDRGRFLGAERRLRDAAVRWAVPLDGPAMGSWLSTDAGVHVTCDYLSERRFATLAVTVSDRPELILKTIGFLRLASALLAAGDPSGADRAGSAEADGLLGPGSFSHEVCKLFCEVVDELVALAGQARAEDASRIIADRGRR